MLALQRHPKRISGLGLSHQGNGLLGSLGSPAPKAGPGAWGLGPRAWAQGPSRVMGLDRAQNSLAQLHLRLMSALSTAIDQLLLLFKSSWSCVDAWAFWIWIVRDHH